MLELKKGGSTTTKPQQSMGQNIEFFQRTMNILHSIVKFLPLGFYFFSYFSATIYKDIKSVPCRFSLF